MNFYGIKIYFKYVYNKFTRKIDSYRSTEIQKTWEEFDTTSLGRIIIIFNI